VSVRTNVVMTSCNLGFITWSKFTCPVLHSDQHKFTVTRWMGTASVHGFSWWLAKKNWLSSNVI